MSEFQEFEVGQVPGPLMTDDLILGCSDERKDGAGGARFVLLPDDGFNEETHPSDGRVEVGEEDDVVCVGVV